MSSQANIPDVGSANSAPQAQSAELSSKFSQLMKRDEKSVVGVTDTQPSSVREHLDTVTETAIEALDAGQNVDLTVGMTPAQQMHHAVEMQMQSAANYLRLGSYAHLAKSTRDGVQTLVKNQ